MLIPGIRSMFNTQYSNKGVNHDVVFNDKSGIVFTLGKIEVMFS